MVLAENQKHIGGFLVGGTNDVENKPDVHAFFLARKGGMFRAIRETQSLIAIAE